MSSDMLLKGARKRVREIKNIKLYWFIIISYRKNKSFMFNCM